MQLAFKLDDHADRIAKIHTILLRHYGQPGPFRQLDPVSQLVMGLVGGKTPGDVSLRAFLRLRHCFPRWEALRDASVQDVEVCIWKVTHAPVKARRLPAALHKITASQGALTLDLLANMSVSEGLAWLECLPGVGRKTAAATLNFSTLRKPALVIDTHHLRVLRRLGLIDARAQIADAYDRIMPDLPAEWTADAFDDHHQVMKLHGQRTCRARVPDCGKCPLVAQCAWARGAERPRR